MAVTINTSGVYKVVRVNNADAATNWTAATLEGGGGGASLLGSVGTVDLVVEGTDARASRVNKQRVFIAYTFSTGYDFTSGGAGTGTTKVPSGIAYIWAVFLAAGSALTKVNGGMQIMLGDGTNRSYWNVAGSDTYSGGFKKWAIYTGITPSENSGANANLGDITEVGFVADVGGTTTRFDNFVVDAMDVGLGLTIQGTTVNSTLFSESVAQDAATAIGVLKIDDGTIKAQGSVLFSGTVMNSSSEKFTFTDTLGGAYTYQFSVTGSATFSNTSIDADGAVNFNFDTSGATAFTMIGGGVKQFSTVTTAVGQTISGVVFQSGGASAIANTLADSTFNQCGTVTVTGVLERCSINSTSSTVAVRSASLAKTSDCTFVKGVGTNHAFELTGAAGSYTWSNNSTGYTAGFAGTGVQITGGAITGNEAIHVTASTGTFIINVAEGASVPSVSSAGAVVDVVAGLVTLTISTQDGNEVRLLQGSYTLQHTQEVTGGIVTYGYTYSAGTKIKITVGGSGFVRQTRTYTLTSSNTTLLFDLDPDPSYL